MHKRGLPVFMMVGGIMLYAISILMPWITVGLGYIPGFEFNAYLLLVLFIYPLYTFIRNVQIHQTYGSFCGIIPIGVLVVLYFNFTGQSDMLGVTVARASFGFYTAFIGCLLVLIAIFMKLKRQNDVKSEKDE